MYSVTVYRLPCRSTVIQEILPSKFGIAGCGIVKTRDDTNIQTKYKCTKTIKENCANPKIIICEIQKFPLFFRLPVYINLYFT